MKLTSSSTLQFCVTLGAFLATRCAGSCSSEREWMIFPGFLLLVLGLSGVIHRLDQQKQSIEQLTRTQQPAG